MYKNDECFVKKHVTPLKSIKREMLFTSPCHTGLVVLDMMDVRLSWP